MTRQEEINRSHSIHNQGLTRKVSMVSTVKNERANLGQKSNYAQGGYKK